MSCIYAVLRNATKECSCIRCVLSGDQLLGLYLTADFGVRRLKAFVVGEIRIRKNTIVF